MTSNIDIFPLLKCLSNNECISCPTGPKGKKGDTGPTGPNGLSNITYFEALLEINQIIADSGLTPISDLSITPGAGTYFVSCNIDLNRRVSNTTNSFIITLRENAVNIPDTSRAISLPITAVTASLQISTQKIITINDGATIDVAYISTYSDVAGNSISSGVLNLIKLA